jgi:glycosyltransferase involved in cell wall biosynthesis
MKAKILFIERKFWKKNFLAFSIEQIYQQIAKTLPYEKFETSFVKVPYGNSFFDILKNFLFFKPTQADIYHITGHVHYLALRLPKQRTVLTIHDLEFLKIRTGLRRFIIKKLFLDLPIRRLKYVTTVSEITKQEILAITNFADEKITIIENPLQEQYLTSRKKAFNKDCPTILQVGIAHNKNIVNLIKSLAGINCCLRIIGNLPEDLLAELNASGIKYENAFGLDEAAMKEEYENADIVTYCSTNEGFGLPIIEGQAMQTSVITSNISPMKEVSGGAAVLVDPNKVTSIREGILKIIEDDAVREKLIENGIENIKRFEPKTIGKLYENYYLEILDALK